MVRSRKRQLEVEDDEFGEVYDTFDLDDTGGTRRGPKKPRRVSGVVKDIKTENKTGSSASALELVFDTLSLKDVMSIGRICPKWYILACYVLRKRYGSSPILRLWTSNKPSRYPDIEWELHFHEQLLAEGFEDEPVKALTTKCSKVFPPINSIISIGSRHSFDQFTYEGAKLPLQQDYIYLICGDAIITTPDFSYTGIADEKFGLDMVVQTFLIPKSNNISLMAFALGNEKDKYDEEQENEAESSIQWTAEKVKSKVEFPVEDVGEGLELRAVLCVHYHPKGPTMGFVDAFQSAYKNVGILSGFTEEIGSNRFYGYSSPWTVGFSIFAGPAANVSIYQVDFEGEDSERILLKMEKQAKTYTHGFCFVFSHDSRPMIDVEDTNEKENWSSSYAPAPKVQEIIGNLRKRMPKTPIFGVNSFECSTAKTVDPKNSNVNENSQKKLCYGFLLATYE